MHFKPISGRQFSKFSGGGMPPDPPPLQGGQKIVVAPAWLKKTFGPQPPGFGFNQVGRSEYKVDF